MSSGESTRGMITLVLLGVMVGAISLGLMPGVGFAQEVPAHVVISEIQADSVNGTGGTDDDWIELYNPTNKDIDLAAGNYRIERSASSGSNPSKFLDFHDDITGDTIISAHGYYLIVDMGASENLRNLSDALTTSDRTLADDDIVYVGTGYIDGPNDSDIVDFIGYGNVTDYEGSGSASNPPDGGSIQRKPLSEGYAPAQDTDDNSADFETIDSPTPMNSGATPVDPAPVVLEGGAGNFQGGYATIQDGVDAASSGNIINVATGTYPENVIINKSLNLQAGSSPVIDPGSGTAVKINAGVLSNVSITGFTIRNATKGVWVTSGANNELHFNNIINNSTGLDNTSGTVVNATGNWWGAPSGPSGGNSDPDTGTLANGSGDYVSANVLFDPWLKAAPSSFPLPANAEETFEVIFDEASPMSTTVNTNSNGPVTFTGSVYADNPGNSLTGDVGRYIDGFVDNPGNIDWIEIRLHYTAGDIAGLVESSLTLHYWDQAQGKWVECSDSGVNTDQNYIYATITAETTPSLDQLVGTPFSGAGNISPTANFDFSPTSPTTQDVIQFTDQSADPDGTIASWSWDFGDGSSSTAQNPTHQYTNDGTYTITLTATDNEGATDTATTEITVRVGPTSNVIVTADPQTLLADGQETTTITARVEDFYDNPISGSSVSFTTQYGQLSSATATTGSGGRASVTLTAPSQPHASTVKATANGVKGSTTVFFQEPGGPDVAGSKSEVIEAGQREGTVNARNEAGMVVNVTKTQAGTQQELSVTAAKYSGNPTDRTALDVGSGGYLDLHADNTNALQEITVKVYLDPWPNEPRVKYWDQTSGEWVECSDYTPYPSAGYLEVTIGPDTEPSLSDLSGLPLAGGGLHTKWVQVEKSGWSMVSVPLEPENGNPTSVYEGVSPSAIFHWDPTANNGEGGYITPNDTYTDVDAFHGCWMYLTAGEVPKTFGVDGVYSGRVEIILENAGWHQVGAPMDYGWSSLGVKRGPDSETMSVAAQAAGPSAPHWMSRFIWEWDPETEEYTAYDARENGVMLEPGKSYWVLTRVDDVRLVIPYSSPPPPPTSLGSQPQGIPMSSTKAIERNIPNPPRPPKVPQSTEQGLEVTAIPNPVLEVDSVTFKAFDESIDAVQVSIFDLSGQVVFESRFVKGSRLVWHMVSESGEPVANGLYLYMITAKRGGSIIKSEVKSFLILR